MRVIDANVSVLFNEPKLLKSAKRLRQPYRDLGFSALQRAEIAEIVHIAPVRARMRSFSALQRAEIAEIVFGDDVPTRTEKFQCSSTSRNC